MTSSKTCFKCKSHLPLSEFYKHSGMGDRHSGKCKTCTKKDALMHRKANIDRIREYDRQRAKLPHRKKLTLEIGRMWRQEDARRDRCHNAAIRAIKSGKLKRLPCMVCGEEKTHAHHEDYDKPLDVMWLCPRCHSQHHAARRKECVGIVD